MTERPRQIIVDGSEAVASVAYRTNEVIAIYPITPASPMGELADAWATAGRTNIWGGIPTVAEMQSEGGAAGAVHGSLQTGALTTTFTASQGLLLMIPNLYKIAGELTGFCMHVAARSVATHALSIFCDHSDVMAARQTGMAMLCSANVQEAHDFALVGQSASLRSRVPFLHFFDGFRTSHEIAKINELSDGDLVEMLDPEAISAHRERGLTPERPVVRGTAQNPDVFFQAREACTPFYEACPRVVEETLQALGKITGRSYGLFDYYGHPEAERVIVVLGSAGETVRETTEWLAGRGERVGVVQVRLYRPFAADAFLSALPPSTRHIAVLDRSKEPGAIGEPLYLDVVAALQQARWNGARNAIDARVVGGRYGLSSKEFTPACVTAVLENLELDSPQDHFTVGIVDDVSHSSLETGTGTGTGTGIGFETGTEASGRSQALFFGLGSDGTVGANKNSIKIVGETTDVHVQGYFVYDSKKAGAMTVSHLRFGPQPIRSAYLIDRADFVACHFAQFLERVDVLEHAADGAVFLLNTSTAKETVWSTLPREVQEQIVDKHLELWVIDADRVAREAGLGPRISTVMQTCFFAISGVLPQDEAISEIKKAISRSYAKRGPTVVQRNHSAVDSALAHLHRVEVPSAATSARHRKPLISEEAPDFVRKVTAVMLANRGDSLPVSAFPVDGSWPLGTSQWEKRAIAQQTPVWDPGVCIQCNQCALVCPHAAIRAKIYDEAELGAAPRDFQSTEYRAAEHDGVRYTIQVAPEDCTGCRLCVEVCPAKDKSNPRHKAIDMAALEDRLDGERRNYDFFLELPEADRTEIARLDAKGSQFLQPLFEYSGACAGCGETPYIKLLTQLFGDRLMIANATGCSSIYGGNLPTTPYTTNADGRGPAWSNSLFEDNAEFGFGFHLATEQRRDQARRLLRALASPLGDVLVGELLADLPAEEERSEKAMAAQRQRVEALRERLREIDGADARRLEQIADALVPVSIWLVGGDGWAYDIGYGGLDHVLASGANVNVLVLDTEVYSNTGGQQSKATPLGAAAKFAASGKETAKKDLGLEAMSYGSAYVARIAFGSKVNQTVDALREADAYPGPSLVLAYSHCIAHGYDLAYGASQQKKAVASGVWPLYRFDPRRAAAGKPPLHLDSGEPKGSVAEYMRFETRFRMVERMDPERFKGFLRKSEQLVKQREAVYRQLAGITLPQIGAEEGRSPAEPSGKGDRGSDL